MLSRDVEDRLIERISVQPNWCWNWTGPIMRNGYGRISFPSPPGAGRSLFTHRVAYQLWRSDIPDGMVIDHLCRNRACCNPDHLEPVAPGENVRRGAWATKTHCKNGHGFTLENTYVTRRGRNCRTCRREAVRRSAARRAR